MSVVDILRSSRSDWLSRRPILIIITSYALTLLIGIAIGQGFANLDLIGKAAGSYHWMYMHQLKGASPAQDASSKTH